MLEGEIHAIAISVPPTPQLHRPPQKKGCDRTPGHAESLAELWKPRKIGSRRAPILIVSR